MLCGGRATGHTTQQKARGQPPVRPRPSRGRRQEGHLCRVPSLPPNGPHLYLPPPPGQALPLTPSGGGAGPLQPLTLPHPRGWLSVPPPQLLSSHSATPPRMPDRTPGIPQRLAPASACWLPPGPCPPPSLSVATADPCAGTYRAATSPGRPAGT